MELVTEMADDESISQEKDDAPKSRDVSDLQTAEKYLKAADFVEIQI